MTEAKAGQLPNGRIPYMPTATGEFLLYNRSTDVITRFDWHQRKGGGKGQ